jgi:hypothetical protein
MAQLTTGILGKVSGKVGNVVGGTWKGINYLRTMAASVNNPNTDLQYSQRLKFSTVIRFLQPITEFIRVGYKGQAVKMTAFNAAFSYNFHNALTGDFPDFAIDYAHVIVSRGNLSGAINPACTSTEAAKAVLSWEPASGSGQASETDTAIFVIFNSVKQEAVYSLNAGSRADGSLQVSLPSSWSGDEVHCYIAFMTMNSMLGGQGRNSISNSSYAGSVIVA